MTFFHFSDYTINLNQIASVTWYEETQCAEVVMVAGDDYSIDGDDYNRLKKAVGR